MLGMDKYDGYLILGGIFLIFDLILILYFKAFLKRQLKAFKVNESNLSLKNALMLRLIAAIITIFLVGTYFFCLGLKC